MLTSRRIAGALLAASAMLFAVPHVASAEDENAEIQKVLDYRLTDAGLAKYVEATKRLEALPAAKERACEDEDTEVESLEDIAAAIDAVPGAKAALRSAGMTAQEYVLFSLSLLHNGLAAWALSQPGSTLPPGVSKANVDFIKKHEAELKQLEALKSDDDCAEQAEADDASE